MSLSFSRLSRGLSGGVSRAFGWPLERIHIRVPPPRRSGPVSTATRLPTPPYEALITSGVASKLAYSTPKHFNLGRLIREDGANGCVIDVARLKARDVQDTLPNGVEDVTFYDATSPEFQQSEPQRRQHTQAFMWVRNGKAFVAFRGTSSAGDVMANLNLRLTDLIVSETEMVFEGPVPRVHGGFQLQLRAVCASIFADLRDQSADFDTVVFTGHSLGGALATLAVVLYRHHDRDRTKDVWCHTFGSPRVGDVAFSRYFRGMVAVHNTWRVVHDEDPVPRVPISSAYEHVPSSVLHLRKHEARCTGYEEGASVEVDDIERFSENLASTLQLRGFQRYRWVNRILQILFSCRWYDPIAPHDMSNYVARLQRHFRNEV